MLWQLGMKISYWVSYQPEPVCYYFLIYKWVFVCHLTETDRTKNSVGTCSGWLVQYLIIFAENSLANALCCCLWFWSIGWRPPPVRPPLFGGWVVCSGMSAKNAEERGGPVARQQFPSGYQAHPFLLRPSGEQVRQDVLSCHLLDPWVGPAWQDGAGRGRGKGRSSGSGQAKCASRSENAEEKEKQVREEGRFERPAWWNGCLVCRHPWLICNLRRGTENCVWTGPECEYLGLCVSLSQRPNSTL